MAAEKPIHNKQMAASDLEQPEAQDALRRREVRYRRLFEAARDSVLIIDPETRKILDANPFMTDLLGCERNELLGKELFEIGLLADEAASRAAFRELQEKGFIRYEDLRLKTKSGTCREVEFVSNIYQENGAEVIQCNIRDITERKQTEKALRASEEQFASIFNQTSVGIVEFDLSGRFVLANDRFCQLVGRTRPEVLELRMQDIMHPEDLPPSIEKFRALVEGHLPSFVTEKRYLRPDGSVLWAQSDVAAIRDAEGRVRSITAAVTDITERLGLKDSLAARART